MKKLALLVLSIYYILNSQAQITVSSNNNVGVGTTTPQAILDIWSPTYSVGTYNALNFSNVWGGFNLTLQTVYTATDGIDFNLIQNYNGTIYNSLSFFHGKVGVGYTTPQYTLDLGTTGVIRASNLSPSDSTLKTGIQNLTGSLSSLLQLKGVTYKYKITPAISSTSSITPNLTGKTASTGNGTQNNISDSAYYSSTHLGFLAQDLQKVYPNLVFSDKKGVLSVDYNGLIAVLVESIKEQQTVITNLQTSNTSLQSSVTALQTSNTSFQASLTALQSTVAALQKKVNSL